MGVRATVLLSLWRSAITCLYYGAPVLTTHFTRLDVCQCCSASTNHSPLSYSVADKFNCMCYSNRAIASMRQTICPFSGSGECIICFPCLSLYGFSTPLTQSGMFVVHTEFLFDIVLSCKSKICALLLSLTAFRCVIGNAYLCLRISTENMGHF